MIDAFLGTLAFALGACVGSFLNVCIGRWPHNESVVSPRSRCPRCAHEIAWYDNIPMVSWMLLRAKCRGCALPISAQYPIVELVVGILWLLAAVHYGATFAALRVAIFATIMLGIAVTDAKHYLIPDGFTVSGLVFVMVTSMVAVFRGEPGPFAEPYDALVGACAGAGAGRGATRSGAPTGVAVKIDSSSAPKRCSADNPSRAKVSSPSDPNEPSSSLPPDSRRGGSAGRSLPRPRTGRCRRSSRRRRIIASARAV